MPRTFLCLLIALALSGLSREAAAKRSFVGKKLPAPGFTDVRGHRILPKDYEGSVLVVLGGIPW